MTEQHTENAEADEFAERVTGNFAVGVNFEADVKRV